MSTQSTVIREPESRYEQISVSSDYANAVTWCQISTKDKACFSTSLIDELNNLVKSLTDHPHNKFFVLTSDSESVFSYGGDLSLFIDTIRTHNKPALYQYMKVCIDTLYRISSIPGYERIALVKGAAFGGGFEAALACDTIIAEKNATFGFPDRLFNSFPGMGAYSYLVRRISPSLAQKIIKSAKTYTAAELHEMGIVDKLVSSGKGYDAVHNHIQQYTRYRNSYDSLKQVFQSAHPVDYNELLQIGELWVDTVMRLSEKDLGLMEKLSKSQENIRKK